MKTRILREISQSMPSIMIMFLLFVPLGVFMGYCFPFAYLILPVLAGFFSGYKYARLWKFFLLSLVISGSEWVGQCFSGRDVRVATVNAIGAFAFYWLTYTLVFFALEDRKQRRLRKLQTAKSS